MVMPPLQIKSGLQQLRQALPREVALWAGGSCVSRQRKVEEGVQLMDPLSDLTEAVGAWRAARSA
jgi:hypothetical protein